MLVHQISLRASSLGLIVFGKEPDKSIKLTDFLICYYIRASCGNNFEFDIPVGTGWEITHTPSSAELDPS